MNKRKGWILIVFLAATALIVSASGPVGAQGKEADKGSAAGSSSSDQKKVATAESAPVYKPPLRGSPGGRVGGGTRGASLETAVSLSVLVPDHVGVTLQSQPNLYWFVSKKTSQPIEFTITEKDAVKPLVEVRLKPLERAGIQCIRLAEHGVQLRPNIAYKWFVAVVTDPARRARDILSGGMIELLPAPADLSEKLSRTPKDKQPFVLAEEGVWYDALAGLSDRIDGAPKELALRKQRAALLQQVGLNEAAEFDLKEARSSQ
jgi:hypothetical protein